MISVGFNTNPTGSAEIEVRVELDNPHPAFAFFTRTIFYSITSLIFHFLSLPIPDGFFFCFVLCKRFFEESQLQATFSLLLVPEERNKKLYMVGFCQI